MDAIEHEKADRQGREALRQSLKTERARWLTSATGQAASFGVQRQLAPLLAQLEPVCLGLYWPLPGEFDAPAFLVDHPQPGVALALPFAHKGGAMHFRRWDGKTPPQSVDEMGIPSPTGEVVDPDVVLVPCLGFTREGYRLGYGGGYFDRWLAAHPGATAVGLAWSVGECQFAVAPHDQPLAVLLTEGELLAP